MANAQSIDLHELFARFQHSEEERTRQHNELMAELQVVKTRLDTVETKIRQIQTLQDDFQEL